MTMWMSVDPMADKYPSISPYAYCAWNPVKLVDPDGMETIENDDGWKVDRKNKTITKCDPLGGNRTQYLYDGNSCTIISGSEGSILSQYPEYSLVDCDGTTLSKPASTALDGTYGFAKGWKMSTNKSKYSSLNKLHIKANTKTKAGVAKADLNKFASSRTVKGIPAIQRGIDVVNLGISFKNDGYRVGENTTKSFFSSVGGFAGAEMGLWYGAYLGTWVFPGLGTAIGAGVGSIVGGIIGSNAGSYVGSEIYYQYH